VTTVFERPALLRRGLLLEYLTVGWNNVEGIVAVASRLVAREGVEALRGEHHEA
jgi:hypothetical protein